MAKSPKKSRKIPGLPAPETVVSQFTLTRLEPPRKTCAMTCPSSGKCIPPRALSSSHDQVRVKSAKQPWQASP